MTEEILIRLAHQDDYDAYCAMVSEIDSLHTNEAPWYFQHPGVPARKQEFFDGLLAAEDKDVFVAEFKGAAAGFLHMETRNVSGFEILVPLDYALVSDIVVTSSMQRKGVGAALMQQAEAWTKQRGLSQLRLNVWLFNRGAIEFYEAFGMQAVSQIMIKRF